MANDLYFWDIFYPELLLRFGDVWEKPMLKATVRQRVATLFVMRAIRRAHMINHLFKEGHYWEGIPLVRAGYEDWLMLSYLLREPGESRCIDFEESVNKLDARIFDSFNKLCGKEATDFCFPDPPSEVKQYIGLSRTKTAPTKISDMADDVGLRAVHDFTYTYLSSMSHPCSKIDPLFDTSGEINVARIPSRNEREERLLSLWFAWFIGRVIALAAKEFEVDYESFISAIFKPFIENQSLILITCVLAREYILL